MMEAIGRPLFDLPKYITKNIFKMDLKLQNKVLLTEELPIAI
jgi:hypothetical protein